VTSVKDQGGCGSCWAFAAAAAYESAHLIQTGTNFDFSEQYAVDCLFPDPLQRCSGGYPGSALSLYNSTGAPPETQYPYYAGTIFNTTLYPNYIGAGMCSATSGYTKLRDLAYMNTFRDNMAETELLT
jgi:C1A family cysteine protease